jgi:hypothetical protein
VLEKNCRVVYIEDWRTLETYGSLELETVKYMFGFTQHNGGLYYGVPNSTEAAADLKMIGATGKGLSGEDVILMTADRFFAKYLSAI